MQRLSRPMESEGRGQLRCGEADKPTSSKGMTTFRRRSVSGKTRVGTRSHKSFVGICHGYFQKNRLPFRLPSRLDSFVFAQVIISGALKHSRARISGASWKNLPNAQLDKL